MFVLDVTLDDEWFDLRSLFFLLWLSYKRALNTMVTAPIAGLAYVWYGTLDLMIA